MKKKLGHEHVAYPMRLFRSFENGNTQSRASIGKTINFRREQKKKKNDFFLFNWIIAFFFIPCHKTSIRIGIFPFLLLQVKNKKKKFELRILKQ